MAFVNELIPEEEKAKFTFPVYTAHDGSKPTLYMWMIDSAIGAQSRGACPRSTGTVWN